MLRLKLPEGTFGKRLFPPSSIDVNWNRDRHWVLASGPRRKFASLCSEYFRETLCDWNIGGYPPSIYREFGFEDVIRMGWRSRRQWATSTAKLILWNTSPCRTSVRESIISPFTLESHSLMWDAQSFSGSESSISRAESLCSSFYPPTRPYARVEVVGIYLRPGVFSMSYLSHIYLLGGGQSVGSGIVGAVPSVQVFSRAPVLSGIGK